ncbi:unnamed protein product, partial [Cylindrotheca closterium]
MWCQEWYSLRHSTKKHDRGAQTPISFGTVVRALRLAASQWLSLDSLNTPQNAYMSQDNKVLYQDCRPTDGLSFHLFAKGMVARMGDYSWPSVALLDRHIRALDHFLDRQFYEATSDVQRRDIALAGLANLVLWLGWLRSAECFGLNWEDCSILEPEDYGQADLP